MTNYYFVHEINIDIVCILNQFYEFDFDNKTSIQCGFGNDELGLTSGLTFGLISLKDTIDLYKVIRDKLCESDDLNNLSDCSESITKSKSNKFIKKFVAVFMSEMELIIKNLDEIYFKND